MAVLKKWFQTVSGKVILQLLHYALEIIVCAYCVCLNTGKQAQTESADLFSHFLCLFLGKFC